MNSEALRCLCWSEDEPRLAANIAAAMREGAGYAVDVARDGEEGVRLLGSATCDLVLLDLMLPRVSDEQVLSRLRSEGRCNAGAGADRRDRGEQHD